LPCRCKRVRGIGGMDAIVPREASGASAPGSWERTSHGAASDAWPHRTAPRAPRPYFGEPRHPKRSGTRPIIRYPLAPSLW
jgi:hypothetical protein